MEDLLDVGVWLDQADHSIRQRVDDAAKDLKRTKNPCKVLPLDFAGNWGRWADELEAGKEAFLRAKEPFYFASLGDAEMALLASGYMYPTPELEGRLRACGFSRAFLSARKEFRDALKSATLLGLQQRWPGITEKIEVILQLCGFAMPPPNAVEVHLPYSMLADGSLFTFLAGRRVVLVGDKVAQVRDLFRNKAFLEAHQHLGPMEKTKIVDVYSTRPKAPSVEGSKTGGSWLDLEPATKWLARNDYDIAILGCGAVANFLARRIHATGRTAIDVGFVFEALLGNDQRNVRPVLRDVIWPERSW